MESLQPLLSLLGGKLGWLPSVVAWIGALRLAAKFFNGRLQGKLTALMVSAATGPDAAGRADWEAVLRARWYRVAAFSLDLVASLKLPGLADYMAALSRDAATRK